MRDKVPTTTLGRGGLAACLVAMLFVAACGSDSPTTPSPTPTASPTPTLLEVDQVSVTVHPLTPPTATAQVSATLRDACEFVNGITQVRSGTTVTVTVGTGRDPASLCTQATVPTQFSVPLDGTFEKGTTYTARVNGVSTTFKP